MRVLIASHSGGLRGGAERCVLELARAFKADGRVDPLVVAPTRGEMTAALEQCGIAHRFATGPTWLVDESPPWPRDPLRALRRAKRAAIAATATTRWRSLLRELSPDVVLTSTTVSPTPALASWRAGIPHVWWVHEYTTLDHHKCYALGEHASQAMIGRLSGSVAVNSQAIADHYAPPIDKAKLRVIHYGIEVDPVDPVDATAGRLRVLLLGRKAPGKGCEAAVRAMGELRDDALDVQLRMVGPALPGYAVQLWELAHDLGVDDRIDFKEYAADPRAHFAWSDVLLMSSFNEAFGRVTVEALKHGRCVIAARGGATTSLVHDGCNGMFFEPGDARGLADAIRRCANDPALLGRLSANARTGSATRFTLEEEVDKFVDLFRSLGAGATRTAQRRSTEGI